VSFGNRFFAVCSAGSDAVVRSATYTLAMEDNKAGGTAATCPAGSRALSGGQANDGAHNSDDRLALSGPFTSPSELNSIGTGAVAGGWSAYGQSSESQARTNRVFALCASDPPPADTTPPDTLIKKDPGTETFATKATFKFSAEPGSTFTCKLDKKKPKPCTSPYKLKNLKVGKHKVTITATDAAGNKEVKPAKHKWTVLKKPAGCTGECRAVPDPPRFKGYLVCSAKKSADAASECGKNKKKTAVFLSKDKDVTYKVCVKFPDDKKLCASHQSADEGVKDAVTVTATTPGTLKATWSVAGEKVASWRMEVT
jgi:hypothetical protein